MKKLGVVGVGVGLQYTKNLLKCFILAKGCHSLDDHDQHDGDGSTKHNYQDDNCHKTAYHCTHTDARST